jgi:glycine betaine/proline transport system ATP-binding protein
MVISRFPLPVVDENHRLRGIIKKERVIEALAGTDSNEVNVNE